MNDASLVNHPSLDDLTTAGDFIPRHIGPAEVEIAAMLKAVGAASLPAFTASVVPAAIRTSRPLALPPALSEADALDRLASYAGRNAVYTSMIGMGYAGTITPKVILRNIVENPGWYTAYTPYQAEVSQGRLEALLNFQQLVIDFTGLEVASASLLDEGTAAAEAMAMARRVGKSAANAFFVDRDTHPQTIAVIETRAAGLGLSVVIGDPATDLAQQPVFAALFSYPGSSGAVRDWREAIASVQAQGGLAIMATDLLAMALLTSPGELGADIAIGSAQRFGVPMGYGGPHAAFFATRDAHKRSMPGRLIGVSVDARGKPALRMALQTREQHIRREKATSNICTAQVLLAVVASMYAVYHGPDGIRRIATRTHRLTQILAAGLHAHGVTIGTAAYFDTLTVHVPGRAHRLLAAAQAERINFRLVDADHLGIALDETTRADDVARVLALFQPVGSAAANPAKLAAESRAVLPLPLQRRTPFLTHPVFSTYHSETEMLRYLRHLQGKDIALDRSMIPLGSCTMKLNATTEMIPITWAGFANLHPFAPKDQALGYQLLFADLEAWLAEITGFDAVSLQPNAGSQGEYAGLMAIRGFHRAQGNPQRTACLIPTSAHGTNPASAVMAGMQVVVVACDVDGNVDIADLNAKVAKHAETIGALMITYPSTHGVFEAGVKEICAIVHAAGGQVYMDGANMNAQVGLMRPGELGADVCHLNLHKTFCIPHGGGGPGMGPICVKSHLAPHLPGHAVVDGINPAGGDDGQISAAPWGSASILPISWAYIAMMGGPGLTRATEIAILNANYIAARLKAHFPILYTGANDRVAHECIIDLRDLKERAGLSVEDVAKRLIDYGFHAPTMSFPVPDTLMIEPTESEGKRELDRFCDAMIAIAGEIAEVETGKADRVHNVLKNAPHTPDLLFSDWMLPYSAQKAFHPLPIAQNWRMDKYWPTVSRVDNAYGDRHIVCTCPPIEAYAEAAE